MFSRRITLVLPALAAGLIAAAPAAATSHPKKPPVHRPARPVRRSHDPAGCADADTPATSASKQAMRTAVVCLINQQRTSRHLPALQANSDLDNSAQGWTDTMVATHQFTHGYDFASRISAAGFHWSSAGENIATGFQTPRQVVRAWMASTGHCQNILSPTYQNVGTGVSAHPVPGFASGPSTWTQDFGLWMGHSAPSGNYGPSSGCPYNI